MFSDDTCSWCAEMKIEIAKYQVKYHQQILMLEAHSYDERQELEENLAKYMYTAYTPVLSIIYQKKTIYSKIGLQTAAQINSVLSSYLLPQEL
jgi:predicted DsbA family dithiol-disulfide isomerase